MADKYAAGIKAGTTSVSHDVLLVSAADGSEITGKLAADFTLAYYRQGTAAVVQVTPLSDLAALNTAWAAGGIKEKSATLARGLYRADYPDAAFLAGADYVDLIAFVSGSQVFIERVPLPTAGPADIMAVAVSTFAAVDTEVATIVSLVTAINAAIAAVKGVTDQFRFTTPNVVDASGGGGGGGDPTAIANAVGARVVESHGNITNDQAMRLMLSILLGVTTSGGAVFKTPDGTTVRVQATLTSQKERVVMALTP